MLREPGKKRICPVAVMQKGMREKLRSLPLPRQHGRSSPYRWLYKSFMNFLYLAQARLSRIAS